MRCGWGDVEVEELAATLREVAHPELVEIDLSGNPEIGTSGVAALGAAIGGGALSSLQHLSLGGDRQRGNGIASLPSELGRLSGLRIA
jgi:hypothetical protein